MTNPPPTGAPALTDLRKDIDRIDEAMHRRLMERGLIIDRLIAVKNTQEVGSAFRPAREADMIRTAAYDDQRKAYTNPRFEEEVTWMLRFARHRGAEVLRQADAGKEH